MRHARTSRRAPGRRIPLTPPAGIHVRRPRQPLRRARELSPLAALLLLVLGPSLYLVAVLGPRVIGWWPR